MLYRTITLNTRRCASSAYCSLGAEKKIPLALWKEKKNIIESSTPAFDQLDNHNKKISHQMHTICTTAFLHMRDLWDEKKDVIVGNKIG